MDYIMIRRRLFNLLFTVLFCLNPLVLFGQSRDQKLLTRIISTKPWEPYQVDQYQEILNEVSEYYDIESKEFLSSHLGANFEKLDYYSRQVREIDSCVIDTDPEIIRLQRNHLLLGLGKLYSDNSHIPTSSTGGKEGFDLLELLKNHLLTSLKSYLRFIYIYQSTDYPKVEKQVVSSFCKGGCHNSLERWLKKELSSYGVTLKKQKHHPVTLEKNWRKMRKFVRKLNDKLLEFSDIEEAAQAKWQSLSKNDQKSLSQKDVFTDLWDHKYQEYLKIFQEGLENSFAPYLGSVTVQNKMGALRRKQVGLLRRYFAKDTDDLRIFKEDLLGTKVSLEYKRHHYVSLAGIEKAHQEITFAYYENFKHTLATIKQIKNNEKELARTRSGHKKDIARRKLENLEQSTLSYLMLANPILVAKFLEKTPSLGEKICQSFSYQKQKIIDSNNSLLSVAIFGGASLVGTLVAGAMVILGAPVVLSGAVALGSVGVGVGVSSYEVPKLRSVSKENERKLEALWRSQQSTTAALEYSRELDLEIKAMKTAGWISLGGGILELTGLTRVLKSVAYGSRLSRLVGASVKAKDLSKKINKTLSLISRYPKSQKMIQKMSLRVGDEEVAEFILYLSHSPKILQKRVAQNMSRYRELDSFDGIFTRSLDQASDSVHLNAELVYGFRDFLVKSHIADDIPVERIDMIFNPSEYIPYRVAASEQAEVFGDLSAHLDIIALTLARTLDEISPPGVERVAFLDEVKNNPQAFYRLESTVVDLFQKNTRLCR